MPSILETQFRKQIAQGFKGRLLTCTLRRVTVTAVNDKGDATTSTTKTYPFEGITESISLYFAEQHGIPLTDVKVLIIAGSLAVDPIKDDQVKIRSEWFQLRRMLTRDPANAHYVFAGFAIGDPT